MGWTMRATKQYHVAAEVLGPVRRMLPSERQMINGERCAGGYPGLLLKREGELIAPNLNNVGAVSRALAPARAAAHTRESL